jgi:hypothetical protein
MDTPQGPGFSVSGSDSLLLEILNVLKRIDGHLKVQQNRIDELDTKIATVTGSATGTAGLTPGFKDSKNNRLKTAPPLRLFLERRASTFPTSPSTRLRDIGFETLSRDDSVQTTSSLSSNDHFGDYEWHQAALVDQLTESPRGNHPGNSKITSSPTEANKLTLETGIGSRRGTLNSLLAPQMVQSWHSDHEKHNISLEFYTKFPPPESWVVTRTLRRHLEVKFGGEEAKSLWKTFVGDSCTIPPDGRIEMTFQQHILERLDKTQVVILLETLQDVLNQLEYRRPEDLKKRGSFKVTDYEFDPNFEDSIAEYRADIPIGKSKVGRIKRGGPKNSIEGAKSAPWKRVM